MSDYEAKNGIIVSPGKFEGEPVWVPGYWDLSLESGYDQEIASGDLMWYVFILDPKEQKIVGECYGITLCEDSQGFVNSAILHSADDIGEL